MMKLIVKFFAALLVLGIGGLFILKKPDGTPWLSLDQILPQVSLSSVKQTVTDALPEQVIGGQDDQVTVYKWRDSEGNWQFSDTPPDGATAEQVLVDTNVNRDLVPELRESPITTTTDSGGKAIFIKDSSLPTPTTLAPDKLTKLIEDANNVQQLMDNRQQQLDEALGSQ